MTNAVVIVESCFGNTATIAECVAQGLRDAGADVEILDAARAPEELGADLVVIAAPTHNAGLSRVRTREEAKRQGAENAPSEGVREWIGRLGALRGRVVTIATTTGSRFAGSAGKAAVKELRRRKVSAEHGQDFHVTGTRGPLVDGERERARDWARTLLG